MFSFVCSLKRRVLKGTMKNKYFNENLKTTDVLQGIFHYLKIFLRIPLIIITSIRILTNVFHTWEF